MVNYGQGPKPREDVSLGLSFPREGVVGLNVRVGRPGTDLTEVETTVVLDEAALRSLSKGVEDSIERVRAWRKRGSS